MDLTKIVRSEETSCPDIRRADDGRHSFLYVWEKNGSGLTRHSPFCINKMKKKKSRESDYPVLHTMKSPRSRCLPRGKSAAHLYRCNLKPDECRVRKRWEILFSVFFQETNGRDRLGRSWRRTSLPVMPCQTAFGHELRNWRRRWREGWRRRCARGAPRRLRGRDRAGAAPLPRRGRRGRGCRRCAR